MTFKGIKDLIKMIRFSGVTLNIGFIGLNFAGGSSKANMPHTMIPLDIEFLGEMANCKEIYPREWTETRIDDFIC